MLYVEALAAPFTINTMPDKTLLAFADHGRGGRAAARRRRRRRGGAGRVQRRRHRASTRCARASSTRAPRLSKRPGTSCCDRSSRRADNSPAGAVQPAARPSWSPERALGDATRNDRTGAAGRDMVRRLLRAADRRGPWSSTSIGDAVQRLAGEGSVGADWMEDLVAKLDAPRAVSLMVPAGAVDRTLRLAGPAARGRRRGDRRRQLLLPGRPAALGAPGRARHRLRGRGTSGGVWGWIAATA